MASTWDADGNHILADAPPRSDCGESILAIFMAVCTIFTLLRLYTRMFIHRELWWDDCKYYISLYYHTLELAYYV